MQQAQGERDEMDAYPFASSHGITSPEQTSAIHLTLNQTLSESLDEGLSGLGDAAKRVLLYHLEHHFYVRKEEFGLKPEEFVHALASLLGDGARVLAQRILEVVRALMDSPFNIDGFIGRFCAKLEFEICKLALAKVG